MDTTRTWRSSTGPSPATTAALALALAWGLGGCTDPVPKVTDPDNIVVDGQKLTHREFLNRYCLDQPSHDTCTMVSSAYHRGGTRSPNGVPRF